MKYSKKEYTFVKFEKSHLKDKKYNAVLKNKKTGREVRVPFGAIRENGVPYPQYKDSTGLGLYSKYDHNDKARRDRYRARHKVYLKDGYWTAANLSWSFLW
jgi:hypothetical protein